jgi:hypothetical protein
MHPSDHFSGGTGAGVMLSACARAATAGETQFRVDYPNSLPRSIKIIALDTPSEGVLRRVAELQWKAATFMTALAVNGPSKSPGQSVNGWLGNLAGHVANLLEQIKVADVVVIVATAGENPSNAAMIADACNLHHVMLTALVIDTPSCSQEALLNTLVALRPHASMLVVAQGEEYIEAMLTALRA